MSFIVLKDKDGDDVLINTENVYRVVLDANTLSFRVDHMDASSHVTRLHSDYKFHEIQQIFKTGEALEENRPVHRQVRV